MAKNRHTIIYPDARWDALCSTAATRGIAETGRPWSASEFIRRVVEDALRQDVHAAHADTL